MVKKIIIFWFCFVSICYAGPQTTSSTTASSIITRARFFLDAPSASDPKWDDTELLQLLNDGAKDISNRSGCYQGTESITLVANTLSYTPTSNYIRIVGAHLHKTNNRVKGLIHGNIRSVAQESGEPTYWFEWDGKVYFYPAYSSVTTETVNIFFTQLPSAVTAGENILTPGVYDDALVYYIVWQAYLSDKRFDLANNFKIDYLSEIDRYRSDFIGADNETISPIR